MSRPARAPARQPAGAHWTHAAAVRATRPEWHACAANCGWPLDPAAAAGGHARHPGCEDLATVIRPDWGNRDQQTRRTA